MLAAGLAVGVVIGGAVGAALLTGAAPPEAGPRPIVLHAAPSLVEPTSALELTAATFCDQPAAASCQIARADALVQPAGTSAWSQVGGRRTDGVWRFRIPGELVPDDGFAYWLRLITGDGTHLSYPPSGAAAPIRVVTSVGLPVESLARFRWSDRLTAAGSLVRLRPGRQDGRVGFSGQGTDEGLQGPSSFDVTPDGDILVADWVHARIQRFSSSGRFRRSVPLPIRRPVDLAVGVGDRIVLSTLGVGAEAFELAADGAVLGRYPVGYGVASRVAAGAIPRVRVGSAQWIAVRSTVGVPIAPAQQAWAQTTTVPLPDGSIGISQDIGDAIAAVWTRRDGSRAGALVRLPRGVAPGADYFVRPLPDGGAVMARGLWDATHFGVALIRFTAAGRIGSFALLPEPTTRMGAPYSTIRFLAPGTVLLAVDDGRGIRIDRFPVR
jgi:hypothetical protein